MECKFCHCDIPNKEVRSYIGRLNRKRVKTQPNPKKLRPCKHCGEMYGAVEIKAHWPVCQYNPRVLARKVRNDASK